MFGIGLMNDTIYIQKLESAIINQLLPIYNKYYETTGLSRPSIAIIDTLMRRQDKKIPALLKSNSSV